MLPTALKYLFCTLFMSLSVTAWADIFKGRVLDESGSPVAGALVTFAGSGIVQLTDDEGLFTLDVPGYNVVEVTVSYPGSLAQNGIIRSDRNVRDNSIRLLPDPTSLDEVVVTATRTPKTLKDVPVVTRLISADEILKSDATNVQDLLVEELPGLEFGYSMTQETSLNMNGFGGNSILFLVDGERLAGETLDNVDYSRLILDNVDRVEIVKGASSALYGANAVGAVVNLITRQNKEPWHLNINGRYAGMGNSWRTGAVMDLNSGHWNSSTTVQYTSSHNVQLAPVLDLESDIHQIFGGNTVNVGERLIYRVNNNLRFTARGGYFMRNSDRVEYKDRFNDYSGGLRADYDWDKTRTMQISYSFDQYDKTRYIDGDRIYTHDYSNRQHIVHGMYTKFWDVNALTVGADFMHDYLESYQFVNNESHTQQSVDAFVQFDYNPVKWLDIVASLRDDYFSASRSNAVTSRLALMFKPAPLTIRASYAGGFRAPTLKEMYMEFDMAGIQMIYGNPDLKPERSHNFTVALERGAQVPDGVLAGSYTLSLSGYYNYYDRRIIAVELPLSVHGEPAAMYVNQDDVAVTGVDFTGRYHTKFGLGAVVSYNYYHTDYRAMETQFWQPRPHSATWKIEYEKQPCSFWRIYASVSGRYLSRPQSSYKSSGAYSLWKFTLQQTLWRGINVNFVIDNLFNYRPRAYYWNSPLTTGTTLSVGVTLNVNELL